MIKSLQEEIAVLREQLLVRESATEVITEVSAAAGVRNSSRDADINSNDRLAINDQQIKHVRVHDLGAKHDHEVSTRAKTFGEYLRTVLQQMELQLNNADHSNLMH